MTEEQIRQNAELYAELLTAGNKEHYRTIYTAAKEGYETGAHSRDEEVEELELSLEAAADVVKILTKQLNELSNPWRDASKELPKEYRLRRSKPVLIQYGKDYTHCDIWIYDYEDCIWKNTSLFPMTPPDFWMPIPQTEKGE